MDMTMECLVVGCSRFDGDFQGQRYRNSKIVYLPKEPEYQGNKKGFLPISLKGPIELFDKISEIPAYYTLKVGLKPSGRGATMEIIDVVEKSAGVEIKRDGK